MSQNTCTFMGFQAAHTLPFPSFPSKEAVESEFKNIPAVWENYLSLPPFMRQELLDFCMGKQGLKITYDTVFRKIFDPEKEQGIKRLEALLSAIMGRQVNIIRIMPREGTQMTENASFVVMDILVQLDDTSFANVEMQKIGYNFPLARADCYVADIIMRQYVDVKSTLGQKFSFNALHKVYSIIMMEKSPNEFHTVEGQYVHRRKPSFDTGIFRQDSGLHEDIFICLDSFRSIVHNITKDSTDLDAWLTFLSATNPETIRSLIEVFPNFTSIYQEIVDFAQNPKELITMLSKELYIMDKNMERLMVAELQEEVIAAKAEVKEAKAQAAIAKEALDNIIAEQRNAMAELDNVVTQRDNAVTERNNAVTERDNAVTERDNAVTERDNAVTERNIFKLLCKGRSPQEIADELQLSVDYVNSILNEN